MRKSLLYLLLLSTISSFGQKNKQNSNLSLPFDTAITQHLNFRNVGPWRGGRSTAVCGDPDDPQVFYFGATGGGVWKTQDGGNNWKNISDGYFGGSVGAISVSKSDPTVIYVGLGENSMRGNVSEGTGIWKSANSGRTWTYLGLPETRHIMRIVIHPKNPDIVYVAAQGHLFGPNTDRGVFKTIDGGLHWQKVCYVDDKTGACDLVMDPGDPNILIAGFWQVIRTPYSLESGGPGSGIYKSTDAGATWQNISHASGLPKDTLGIVGLAIAPSDPDIYYAIIESKTGGVFRSEDAGKTWTKTSDNSNLRQRAWYFSKIYVDPKQSETVYVLNVEFWKSTNGARDFKSIPTPHGDHHGLWIDDRDPQRMIVADDGGAQVSFNGGNEWSSYYNQPTAQIYRVSTDNAVPYRILGAQQDNSSLRIRHRGTYGQIGNNDWQPTAGFESGYIVADPLNPDIVYGGNYSGYIGCLNHDTRDTRNITVWPDDPIGQGAGDQAYRFQWNFPLFFSPHDPNRLYAAGNVLFYTDDAGTSWHAMSPDLTTNTKSMQQPSGGIITKDNTGVEVYCTIFAASESGLEKGVIYTGSDDGLVYVTKNNGSDWQNITPKDLPPYTMINCIETDPIQKGKMYFAATRYKLDDEQPLLYVTEDYGVTWKKIINGISPTHFTRVIRADRNREGLLYCGTERGLYISYNGGNNWYPFQLNLPIVPITDMTIKDNDLIIATQGRGFWVLDNITMLQQMQAVNNAFISYPVRNVYRMSMYKTEKPVNAGENPEPGVVFDMFIPAAKAKSGADSLSKCSIEIKDHEGKSITTLATDAKEKSNTINIKPGFNRISWDMHYPGGKSIDGMFLWNGVPDGPLAAPGNYTAEINYGNTTTTQSFFIEPDPNSTATLDDYRLQHVFLMEMLETFNSTQEAILDMQEMQKQMRDYLTKLDSLAPQSLKDSIANINKDLDAIINTLYETRNKSSQDMLNYGIKLNDKLSGVIGAVSTGNFRPGNNQRMVYYDLKKQIDMQLEFYRDIKKNRISTLNKTINNLALPVIITK